MFWNIYKTKLYLENKKALKSESKIKQLYLAMYCTGGLPVHRETISKTLKHSHLTLVR